MHYILLSSQDKRGSVDNRDLSHIVSFEAYNYLDFRAYKRVEINILYDTLNCK